MLVIFNIKKIIESKHYNFITIRFCHPNNQNKHHIQKNIKNLRTRIRVIEFLIFPTPNKYVKITDHFGSKKSTLYTSHTKDD